MKSEPDILRQFINLIAIVAAFGTNVAANLAPIKGLNIGEISNTLFKDVLITPANYAFAIWGVIYLGLFSFAIYQVLPNQRQNPHLRQVGSDCLGVLFPIEVVFTFLIGNDRNFATFNYHHSKTGNWQKESFSL